MPAGDGFVAWHHRDMSDADLPFGPLASGTAPLPRSRSYWVIDGRLAGGAYPFASTVEAGRNVLDRIVASGVDAFVDLTQAGDPRAWESELIPYAPYLEGRGVVVRRHPIRDMDVTTPPLAAETLDSVDWLLAEGRTVYVHCYGGIGRTATILGCWLMRHGYADADTVLDTLTDLRRQDLPRGHWRAPQTEQQRLFVVHWSEPG